MGRPSVPPARLIALVAGLAFAACAQGAAPSDDDDGTTRPDAYVSIDAPPGAVDAARPDARPIDASLPIDASIPIDAAPPPDAGPFCTQNTQCATGNCCLNLGQGQPGFCVPGLDVNGFCVPTGQ